MTRPTEDQNNAQAQDNSGGNQVSTPLLAALGAGNLATQAVVDAVNKAKDRVTGSGEAARKNFEELPKDVEQLRDKLDTAELRKVVEEYTEAARNLYEKLAESGAMTLDQILAQPQVKKALKQLQDALENAQDRVGDATGDARERAEEVLSMVGRRTRATGDQTAHAVPETADTATDKVAEADDKVAETRAGTKDAPHTASSTQRTTSANASAKKAPANAKKSPVKKTTN